MSGRAIFATGVAIHYSGGMIVGDSERLAGWPACVSGRGAFKVRERGNQTADVDRVDCKACLRLLLKASKLPCPACKRMSRITTAGCDHCDLEDK